MEASSENNDGVEVLRLRGKLDSTNAGDFDVKLRALGKAENIRGVVLEMSGIATLTSAPLRNILSLTKRLKQVKVPLFLAAPSENCLEALQISGFLQLKLFEIRASVEDVIRTLAGQTPAAVPAANPPPMPAARPTQAAPVQAAPVQAAPVQRTAPLRAPEPATIVTGTKPLQVSAALSEIKMAAPVKPPPAVKAFPAVQAVPAAAAPPRPDPVPPPAQAPPLPRPAVKRRGPLGELAYAMKYWLKKLTGR